MSFYDYYFTGQEKQYDGITVRQIARVGDGLVGGWIQSEKNLIIEDVGYPAWVGGDAIVYGDAIVDSSATVDGWAVVYGKSRVTWASHVTGCAKIKDSLIKGRSFICNEAFVEASVIDDSVVESSGAIKSAELKFCKFKLCAGAEGVRLYNRIYDGKYWIR